MMWNPFAAANPAGLGQQTLVGQVIGSGGTQSRGRAAGPRRRRKAKASTSKRRASSPRRAGKKARLVKGSKAAKAYMAKIRRKRRK